MRENITEVDKGGEHPRAPSMPATRESKELPGASPSRNPADDAPAGTVGTGEDVCPRCGGSGKITTGAEEDCPDCDGTGIVIQGIGGG